jgi:chromosome segregation ATPase
VLSENSLAQLEDHVNRVAACLKDLESENFKLKGRIEQLEEELVELKRERFTRDRNIDNLKHERLEIRTRVKRIRENLAALERPMKESTT